MTAGARRVCESESLRQRPAGSDVAVKGHPKQVIADTAYNRDATRALIRRLNDRVCIRSNPTHGSKTGRPTTHYRSPINKPTISTPSRTASNTTTYPYMF